MKLAAVRGHEERNALVADNLNLVYWAMNYVRAKGDDFFQAGCLGLIRAAELWSEKHGTKFSTYAGLAIMSNIANLRRREERQAKIVTKVRAAATGKPRGYTFEPELDSDEEKDAAAAAIAKIGADDRAAIELYFDNGSLRKVAKKLGISPEAARKRLHSGLEEMREIMRV